MYGSFRSSRKKLNYTPLVRTIFNIDTNKRLKGEISKIFKLNLVKTKLELASEK